LLPKRAFFRRRTRYAGFSFSIFAVLPASGTFVYHGFGSLSWTDAFMTLAVMLFAPVYHRFLNKMYLDMDNGRQAG